MGSSNNSNPPDAVNSNSNQPSSGLPGTTSTQSSATLGPLRVSNGIRITERFMESSSWPTELILDLGKANWFEWSRELNLLVLQCGLKPWLEGTLACPDPSISPDNHFVWTQNDGALRGFILARISWADMGHVEACTSAHDLFTCLRTLHEKQGTYTKIRMWIKILEIRFNYDTPLQDTLAEIRSYYYRITAMGKITDDDIFTAMLLHSMSDHFVHLQQAVKDMAHFPNFNSEMIVKRILDEDALIRRRCELGQPVNPYGTVSLASTQSAFAAQQSRQRAPKPFCTNYKRDHHSADFCIFPGGKMAGRTAEEARAAFKATLPRSQRPSSSSRPQSSARLLYF